MEGLRHRGFGAVQTSITNIIWGDTLFPKMKTRGMEFPFFSKEGDQQHKFVCKDFRRAPRNALVLPPVPSSDGNGA